MTPHSPATIQRAHELRIYGLGWDLISRELNVPSSTIRTWFETTEQSEARHQRHRLYKKTRYNTL